MVSDPIDKRRKIKNSEENRKKCACHFCPSYPTECNGEILYCSTGKSSCDIKPKVCICSECQIYAEYDLKDLYYCNKEEVGQNKTFMRKKRTDEDDSFYQNIVNIKDMTTTGKSIVCSMGSPKKLPFALNDLHFIPAQVHKIPLNMEDSVNTEVIIGKNSTKPLKIPSPLIISGMSFGAVSENVKLIIANVADQLKIAFNSGEGGVLKGEIDIASDHMIAQYSTGRFGVSNEILRSAAAVEIRFGQGAYPGKGSYLPAEKVNSKIAEIRGLKPGEPAYSPAHHPDIKTHEEIKEKVVSLRKITDGVPIGAKIGCGNIEKDIEILVDAEVDFITLDGFGGGTGATDLYVRENVGVPIFVALPRAYKFLDELGVKDEISLIAGGKLVDSADFAKCLALGADAVYTGTTALIAINCEQYRICYTGLCPTGITTQDSELMKQLDIEEGVEKLANFIKISTQEIANLARIVGKNDINKLDKGDLVSLNRDLSKITGIKWVNGKYLN